MTDLLFMTAAALLLTVAASLVRVLRGPTRPDRMMGAQLAATAGVAILLLLSVAAGSPAILDVALVLALLAAFAAVAFVKAASPDGAGDPEEETP
ncbi:monovalent cation/H+ antiporter complex subunit F [Rhodopseudomonas palustris]|uniref:monovalent cation/H+ antiporter complex subunit F n=1 Tax=Rhodopseudomonas palustris TaxID=1076 RepID=UPI002ACE4C4A|nr:monovalent cation/H+ antiporter complex subunit F [Rhodopseudomonas palustris]WQG99789.1 monovalent cation/H+ antiporter complex subunit F [Rhodopseudomonas palustris]